MAKGDSVTVRSEIGGKLETDEIRVTGSGGSIEVDWDKKQPLVHVELKGRTGKINQRYSYALSAVRSVVVIERDQ